MKKIAVVTGTRAEYGLLSPLMHKIKESTTLQLQVIVTGAHLLPQFGLTVREIEADGFVIDHTVPEISSASDGHEVARQVGAGTIALTDVFLDLVPDAVVLVGDRFELMAAATAAMFLNIPIVHVHGGEVTHGAFDDAVRHAISQFSRIHCVAAPEYAARLIRAGAQPDSVHVVGGLGVDALHSVDRMTSDELSTELGMSVDGTVLLVTFHPVTAAAHDTQAEVSALIEALEKFPDATVVFTAPNADPEHRIVRDAIAQAVGRHKNWHVFSSLGLRKYSSLLAHASAVVGNSSSGLLEAPSLGIPTVNVGPRQDGRLMAMSVLSCGTSAADIRDSITHALSPSFRESLAGMETHYGGPGAADRILSLLEATAFDSLAEKKYYDLLDKG